MKRMIMAVVAAVFGLALSVVGIAAPASAVIVDGTLACADLGAFGTNGHQWRCDHNWSVGVGTMTIAEQELTDQGTDNDNVLDLNGNGISTLWNANCYNANGTLIGRVFSVKGYHYAGTALPHNECNTYGGYLRIDARRTTGCTSQITNLFYGDGRNGTVIYTTRTC
jgi:hypothetical protein